MDSGCEADIFKNLVDMLLPKSGRFGMALHGTKDRDNMALWNWWVTAVIRPPFMKGAVRADEETLFRGRCLSKGITNVGAMNNVVLDGANSIK